MAASDQAGFPMPVAALSSGKPMPRIVGLGSGRLGTGHMYGRPSSAPWTPGTATWTRPRSTARSARSGMRGRACWYHRLPGRPLVPWPCPAGAQKDPPESADGACGHVSHPLSGEHEGGGNRRLGGACQGEPGGDGHERSGSEPVLPAEQAEDVLQGERDPTLRLLSVGWQGSTMGKQFCHGQPCPQADRPGHGQNRGAGVH